MKCKELKYFVDAFFTVEAHDFRVTKIRMNKSLYDVLKRLGKGYCENNEIWGANIEFWDKNELEVINELNGKIHSNKFDCNYDKRINFKEYHDTNRPICQICRQKIEEKLMS